MKFIKESLNNEQTATVNYPIEFGLENGKIVPFTEIFTLKLKGK